MSLLIKLLLLSLIIYILVKIQSKLKDKKGKSTNQSPVISQSRSVVQKPELVPVNTDDLFDYFDTNLLVLPRIDMIPDYSKMESSGQIYKYYTLPLQKPEKGIFDTLNILKYNSHTNYTFTNKNIKSLNSEDLQTLLKDLREYFPYTQLSNVLTHAEKQNIDEQFKNSDIYDIIIKMHTHDLYSTQLIFTISKDQGAALVIIGQHIKLPSIIDYFGDYKNHRSIPITEDFMLDSDWNHVICSVAGIQFNQIESVVNLIDRGLVLNLERETASKHSDTATVISVNGYKLGYIPSRLSPFVAESIGRGDKLTAVVLSYDPLEDHYYQLKILILKNHEQISI